ncbi:MAG TPA: methionyl-tRNA formyltransferase, partial [Epsilonproteobacteria bacterium]|nr:methionyl-tRNA formyltransferase [Campylobacterota bacterium]
NGPTLDALQLVEGLQSRVAGEVLGFDKESVIVGCNRGTIHIGTLQPASQNALPAKAYCVGRGIKIGHTLF